MSTLPPLPKALTPQHLVYIVEKLLKPHPYILSSHLYVSTGLPESTRASLTPHFVFRFFLFLPVWKFGLCSVLESQCPCKQPLSWAYSKEHSSLFLRISERDSAPVAGRDLTWQCLCANVLSSPVSCPHSSASLSWNHITD